MEVLPAGHQIGGYQIVRVAGSGAVGVVYEAVHRTLGRRVAIKTLNRTFAGEDEFRARFDREAQGAASIDHPNITSVMDAGEQDGVPYLVMTYVDGPDLERILGSSDDAMDPETALSICRDVAEALDAAAAQGLAHRDVKPANILLQDWDPDAPRKPRVYLTDFGLTKHNAAQTVTRTGQFVGTLLYMAPEQIEGHAIPASDQYSLACVLWELLTGGPPYLPSGGSHLSLLTAHLSDPIPLISQRTNGRFPRELDTVFATAMAKKAADRYPNCIAFVAAAAAVIEGGTADPPTPPADSGSGPRPVWTGPAPRASSGADPRSPEPAPSGPAPSGPAPSAPRPSRPSTPGPSTPGPSTPGGLDPSGASMPPAHGSGRSGPPGLPPGLSPDAYRQTGGGTGATRWLIALLVLLVIGAVAVGLWAVLGGGDDVAVADGDVVDGVQDTGGGVDDDTSGTSDGVDDDTSGTADGVDDPGEGQGADDGNDEAGAEDQSGTADQAGEDAPSDLAPAPGEQGMIAFVGNGQLWVASADGESPQPLVELPGPVDGQPALHPDGDRLVVAIGGALNVVDLSTGEIAPLTEGPDHSDPAWLPGDAVVFSQGVPTGGRDLAIVSPDGAVQPLRLIDEVSADDPPTAVLNRPAVDPVTGDVAFHAAGPADLDIWVGPTDGGLTRLDGPGNDFHPAWTPDGQLVFSSDRGGGNALYLSDRAGTDVRPLIGPPVVPNAKDADVSPCGDWVVFQIDDPDGGEPTLATAPLGVDPDPSSVLPLQLPRGVLGAADPGWGGGCPAP